MWITRFWKAAKTRLFAFEGKIALTAGTDKTEK
jgi:hypothetical protein